jgi:uncharacterized protein (AIM24 family)
MAQFEVIEDEGVSFVKATLDDEMIRAERGALCYLMGDIRIDARLPPVSGIIKRVLAEQSIIRPRYTGKGEVYLESSVGGFHIFEMDETPWILEKGAYWASDGEVTLSVFRETVMTSLFSGEGFVALQTRVRGQGKVVLKSRGPQRCSPVNGVCGSLKALGGFSCRRIPIGAICCWQAKR